ncbi:hypothetical protein SAMN05518872_103132 [Psychrobacillus sp. OK032]|nr:hypothetical protein SAMN05518872_103132 [Psychrobacillus sp. OK032]
MRVRQSLRHDVAFLDCPPLKGWKASFHSLFKKILTLFELLKERDGQTNAIRLPKKERLVVTSVTTSLSKKSIGNDIAISLSKDLRKRYKTGFVLRGCLNFSY